LGHAPASGNEKNVGGGVDTGRPGVCVTMRPKISPTSPLRLASNLLRGAAFEAVVHANHGRFAIEDVVPGAQP